VTKQKTEKRGAEDQKRKNKTAPISGLRKQAGNGRRCPVKPWKTFETDRRWPIHAFN
jgi:hypothetical protein